MAYWNGRVVYENGRIKRFETSDEALAFLTRCDAAGKIINRFTDGSLKARAEAVFRNVAEKTRSAASRSDDTHRFTAALKVG